MQPSNNNGLREIRLIAALTGVSLLFLHFYYTCYAAFTEWGLTAPILDRLATNIAHSGLFHYHFLSKTVVVLFLAITMVGLPQSGAQPPKQSWLKRLVTGVLLYTGSELILLFTADPQILASGYIGATLAGLIYLYIVARPIAARLYARFSGDIFNRYNESFPQEERLLMAPYAIHLRARYTFRDQVRDSVISLVDIFRHTMVMGTPGSGKTRFIFRQLIQQSLANNMALFVYDLKYDDLTRLTYNTLRRLKTEQTENSFPTFYSVNFDDFSRSHRLNAIPPESLEDISDASECSRTILYALNKKWIHEAGSFFVESAISFFTAVIWFLRRYENGRYCTLPHLIELIQTDYDKLFSILRSYPECETRIGSFVSAYTNKTMDQLQGQIDSARIPLSSLASPNLYYLLSGNDFTLDINNPAAPKVVCIGSNPQKQHVYGAIVSLYVSRMTKLVNRKGGIPCHILYDEFPSFYADGIDLTLATARSNKVAVTIGIQDLSQLRKTYGRDHADALFNLPGNLICSQVSGDSASLVSARFGKILQEKTTFSTNSRDSSTSESLHLDLALPPSKISTLSSGEFVGIVADSPTQPIQLKAFHARIVIDNKAIEKEEQESVPIPEVRTVTRQLVDFNFRQIKENVRNLVDARLQYMHRTPALARLIVKQNISKKGPRQSPK